MTTDPAAVPRRRVGVIGAPIDALDWDTALSRLSAWGAARESRYVCICNVHSVVTASRQADFARALASADMATADGAPVAWMLRRLGAPGQQRINGPDLMLRLCEVCAASGTSVFLFGSTPEVLQRLQNRLLARFPRLRIAGSLSPPFRRLTAEESAQQIEVLNDSGAGIVFVSLGCPKQELWMAEHCRAVRAVTIGVGAAFDFHSGLVQRAPDWMRGAGLEWLHRLASEPRRLWRRYLVTNSIFIAKAGLQLLRRGATTRT